MTIIPDLLLDQISGNKLAVLLVRQASIPEFLVDEGVTGCLTGLAGWLDG